jgi:hypothetical protein
MSAKVEGSSIGAPLLHDQIVDESIRRRASRNSKIGVPLLHEQLGWEGLKIGC